MPRPLVGGPGAGALAGGPGVKLHCQRTDRFEVLGARYKAVWGSTLGAVATVHEGSLGIDRGLSRHVCAPLIAVREGEEAAEQVWVYPDGYRGVVLTDLQSSI